MLFMSGHWVHYRDKRKLENHTYSAPEEMILGVGGRNSISRCLLTFLLFAQMGRAVTRFLTSEELHRVRQCWTQSQGEQVLCAYGRK